MDARFALDSPQFDAEAALKCPERVAPACAEAVAPLDNVASCKRLLVPLGLLPETRRAKLSPEARERRETQRLAYRAQAQALQTQLEAVRRSGGPLAALAAAPADDSPQVLLRRCATEGRTVRVALRGECGGGGRTLRGTLVAFDRSMNLLMAGVSETFRAASYLNAAAARNPRVIQRILAPEALPRLPAALARALGVARSHRLEHVTAADEAADRRTWVGHFSGQERSFRPAGQRVRLVAVRERAFARYFVSGSQVIHIAGG